MSLHVLIPLSLSATIDPACQQAIPNLDGGEGHSDVVMFETNVDLSTAPEEEAEEEQSAAAAAGRREGGDGGAEGPAAGETVAEETAS